MSLRTLTSDSYLIFASFAPHTLLHIWYTLLTSVPYSRTFSWQRTHMMRRRTRGGNPNHRMILRARARARALTELDTGTATSQTTFLGWKTQRLIIPVSAKIKRGKARSATWNPNDDFDYADLGDYLGVADEQQARAQHAFCMNLERDNIIHVLNLVKEAGVKIVQNRRPYQGEVNEWWGTLSPLEPLRISLEY